MLKKIFGLLGTPDQKVCLLHTNLFHTRCSQPLSSFCAKWPWQLYLINRLENWNLSPAWRGHWCMHRARGCKTSLGFRQGCMFCKFFIAAWRFTVGFSQNHMHRLDLILKWTSFDVHSARGYIACFPKQTGEGLHKIFKDPLLQSCCLTGYGWICAAPSPSGWNVWRILTAACWTFLKRCNLAQACYGCSVPCPGGNFWHFYTCLYISIHFCFSRRHRRLILKKWSCLVLRLIFNPKTRISVQEACFSLFISKS